MEIHLKSGQDCGKKLIKMVDTTGGHYGHGLEDVENLMNLEKEELKDALLADRASDNIGAKYLKVINSVS